MRQTKLKVTKSAKITDFFKRESDSPRNDQRSRTDSPMTTPTGSEKTPFKVRNKRISSEFIAMDTKNIPTSVNTETKRTGQLLTSASKEDKSNSKEILQYSDNTLQDKADKKRTLFKRHNSVEIIIPKLHIRKAPRSLKKHTSEQNLHSVVNTSKLSTLEKIVNEVLDCTRIKDLHESRPTDQDDYSKISQFKKNKSSVIPPNDEVLVVKSVKNPLTDSKKLKFLKTKNPLQISNMEKRKENNPSIIISKKSWGNFKTSVLVETDNNSLLTRKKSINSEFNVMDIENEENISEKYLENPLGIKPYQNKQQISALGAIVSSESTTANTPQRIKIIPSEMNVSTPTRMEIIDVDIEIEPDVTSGVLSDGSLFSKMAGAGDGSATNLNESSKVNTDTFSSTGSVNAMVDSSEKDLKSSRPPTLEPDSIEQCVTSEIEPSPSKRPPVKDKQKSKKSVINMDESLDDLFETISPRKKDSRKSPLESFNSSTKKQKIENDNHKSVVHETDHQTSIKDGISKSITFDEDDLLDFAEVPISTTSNPFLSDDEDFLELYKPPATIKKSDNHVMDNSDSDDELLSNLPQSVLNETHKRVTRSATKSVTKPNYLKIGRKQEDFDDMGDMVKSLQSLVKSAKTNKSQMEKYDALSKDLQQDVTKVSPTKDELVLEELEIEKNEDDDVEEYEVVSIYQNLVMKEYPYKSEWSENSKVKHFFELCKSDTAQFYALLNQNILNAFIRAKYISLSKELVTFLISLGGESTERNLILSRAIENLLNDKHDANLYLKYGYLDLNKQLIDIGINEVFLSNTSSISNYIVKSDKKSQRPSSVTRLSLLRYCLDIILIIVRSHHFNSQREAAAEILSNLCKLSVQTNSLQNDKIFELITLIINSQTDESWGKIEPKFRSTLQTFFDNFSISIHFVNFLDKCKQTLHCKRLRMWSQNLSFTVLLSQNKPSTVWSTTHDMEEIINQLSENEFFNAKTSSYMKTYQLLRILGNSFDAYTIDQQQSCFKKVATFLRAFHNKIDDRSGTNLDRSMVKDELLRLATVIQLTINPLFVSKHSFSFS